MIVELLPVPISDAMAPTIASPRIDSHNVCGVGYGVRHLSQRTLSEAPFSGKGCWHLGHVVETSKQTPANPIEAESTRPVLRSSTDGERRSCGRASTLEQR